MRVRRLPQVKMTFLPHSVVQPDSTEHSSRRKGRPEADIGPTWFFCPMVKPPELRGPWQRQIHARKLQSHSRGEVIVAADAVAVAAAVVVVAVAVAAIPPSAASLPPPLPPGRPPLLLPPSLPPLPGDGPAGSRAGEAERGPRHRKGNGRATVKLFPLPTAPWPTRNLRRKSFFWGCRVPFPHSPKRKQNKKTPPKFVSSVVS